MAAETSIIIASEPQLFVQKAGIAFHQALRTEP
jgi:hypothetical protein